MKLQKKKIKFILAEILTIYYKHFKYYIIFKLHKILNSKFRKLNINLDLDKLKFLIKNQVFQS